MENYKKKYKEALEKAKGIINYYKEHNRGDEAAIEDLEEIFPELKESEDERISREITEFIVNFHNGNYEKPYDYTIGTWLAWLEKQTPKPKWSEEDEELCQDALDAFEALANDLNPSEDWGKLYDWLKSIKQKMNDKRRNGKM